MKTGKFLSNLYPTYHKKKRRKKYISVTFRKNTGYTGGKLRPQDKISTRLQEVSLIKNTYFGAIHYDLHLDMKLDF